jgi:hypothetical protein
MTHTFKLRRPLAVLAATTLLAVLAIPGASAMAPQARAQQPSIRKALPERSSIYDIQDSNIQTAAQAAPLSTVARLPRVEGSAITECPQAGLSDNQPRPLDLRNKDQVEQLGDQGNDIRVNQDYSCFPQNETSIAVSSREPRNLVAGANDYRLGTGSSGFYASTDGGKSWYDGIIPFPSGPAGITRGEGIIPSGGDPVVAFDRAGVAYYSQIGFFRGTDVGGVFVSRSTNGGFTWSRACIPVDATPDDPNDDAAVCGGPGDVRQPGDGLVAFTADNDTDPNSSVSFDDKEWMTVGPRPDGVEPVCFTPITRTATDCDQAVIGADRLYVTFTRFAPPDPALGFGNSQIYLSYSDDQARSWSPPNAISGSAPFCVNFGTGESDDCDLNQYSVPTVNPKTGHLYVAWLNGNTLDEDQYVMVRSKDGGQTFEGPFFITSIYDLNYPRGVNGRTDCVDRGQGDTRQVLTNNCFRLNSGGNIVVDKRGGKYADDLYVVVSDNRNGTIASTNVDVFLFKSNDGGTTWIGPTRVNDDRSVAPPDRDCGRDPQSITGDPSACGGAADYGNDQWFPWVDINEKGHLNVVFHDRRLDANSEESEWPDSRQRRGNYLAWFWGAQCEVSKADSLECTASEASTITQPTEPVDPGAGPQPGQGQHSFPLRNFAISDVPFNLDYTFRAGLFMGDYNNVAVSNNNAYAFWTDSRNGRSSQEQPGRNPICEQSDVFLDIYGSNGRASGASARSTDALFLVTPCPVSKK